jgi:hypothetical protein
MSNVRHLGVGALLASLLALTGASPVISCTCIGTSVVSRSVESSDVVFSGMVVSARYVALDTLFKTSLRTEYRFQVQTAFKGGESTDTITIITGVGGGDCGLKFDLGARYIVYAYWSDHRRERGTSPGPVLYTDRCTRTKAFDREEVREIEQYLDQGRGGG